MVSLKFESEHTPGETYELLIKTVEDAIRINANNPEKLEDIKRDLIFYRMEVDHLLALNFQKRSQNGHVQST